MTQNPEDLPMLDDELGVRTQAVNKIAADILPKLLADLEEVTADKDLRNQYEIDFLGDLYARMVVSVFMGFYPEIMGEDAQSAALRLIKMAGVKDYD
jgi:hypothetical protein